MICVPPGSTVSFQYIPMYDGQPISGMSSFSVSLVHDGGSNVDLTSESSWYVVGGYLRVTIPSNVITQSDNNSIAQVVWTWVYNNQTYRDVEKFCITDSSYGEMTVRLRKYLKDTGSVRSKYYVGDGITTHFSFDSAGSHVPIDTLSVFVGGVLTNYYTVSKLTGTVTLSAAPSASMSVSMMYMRYDYSNDELEEFLAAGISAYNRYFGTSLSNTAIPAGADVKTLVLLLSVRELYIQEMLRSNKESVSWRDEEKAVSRTSVPRNYVETLKALEDQVNSIVRNQQMRSTRGAALAGGNIEMVKFETIDWTSANG